MSNRIGLVGYSCRTGLGELNRQIAAYAEVDVWMVKPHPKHPSCEPHPNVETIACPHGHKVDEFLSCVDTVLFCEMPYYSNLVELAKAAGKRVVCVPMQEWMPEDGWIKDVDLFLCPTKHCYRELSAKLPCVYFPWPIDTDRFKPSIRPKAHRFLFINGHGGWNGRKGIGCMLRAKDLWPSMPLVVVSQQGVTWPNPSQLVMQGPVNNYDLYDYADVLIAPHSADGIGLELLEAAACGMPVISTLGHPWNEFPAIGRIRSTLSQCHTRKLVDWYLPDAEHLVSLCRDIHETPISYESQQAANWASRRTWGGSVDLFNELVRNGKPGAIPCPTTTS